MPHSVAKMVFHIKNTYLHEFHVLCHSIDETKAESSNTMVAEANSNEEIDSSGDLLLDNCEINC